jgi:predicted hotdog family 3-hydroxylacyl-ACP dehydratase
MMTNAFAMADLLPHSGQMILLDSVTFVDDTRLTANLVVRDDGLLLSNTDSVPAWTGIEYMAQAIGAYVGIQAKQAGLPIRLGFLLGTRRYESNVDSFPVGSSLSVSAEKILQDGQLGVFDCRICGDNVDISATLNVYQPPESLTSTLQYE